MTLACEDGNSKLVEVVTVIDVDDEKQFTPQRLVCISGGILALASTRDFL